MVALVLGVAAVQAPQALASRGGGLRAALAPATVVTVTPWIRLSRHAGPPTGMFGVSGGRFGASESVDVYFDSTDEVLVTTNANGYFAPVNPHVPAAAAPGVHWVTAKGRASGLSAQRRFMVATQWDQFGRVPNHTHTRWLPIPASSIRPVTSKTRRADGRGPRTITGHSAASFACAPPSARAPATSTNMTAPRSSTTRLGWDSATFRRHSVSAGVLARSSSPLTVTDEATLG